MTGPAAARLFTVVIVVAAFCSSSCLFLIELFAGKLLLPRFGGAPGVWVSCLAFFQVALVAAYFHADRLITRCGPRWQVISQAAVFAGAVAIVPLGVSVALEGDPRRFGLPLAVTVILVLAATVGPLFYALATLSPLFGHWWTRARQGRGEAAYGLYAAGNAGSFAALIGYPFVIEPAAGLAAQAGLTIRLYAVVAVLAIACGGYAAWCSRRHVGQPLVPDTAPGGGESIPWSRWLRWALLAAVPASWLSSLTTHATVEVAPIPLLWVVPLAVYLASFVVVFSQWGRRLRPFEPAALAAAVAVVAWLIAGDVTDPTWGVLAAHLAGFLVVCVGLHGMLVDERPAAEQLSSFYLAMSVGGACGGLWNALVAPALFNAHHEFPLAVAVTAGLVVHAWQPWRVGRRWLVIGGAAAAVAVPILVAPWLQTPRPVWLAILATAIVVPLVALRQVERAALLVAVFVAMFCVGEKTHRVSFRTRTFFGVLRVCEDANGPSRRLMHGSITHGVQLVSADVERRRIPLSYYAETGPLGSVVRAVEAVQPTGRVGVAGLGVGTIAAYARPGQEFVFFEIDPAVVRIAEDPRWFTFLADCRGKVRVVVDDARLALEREPDGSFDLLVIDAFTGDSVPTHLLTREAFQLYGRKLTAEGVLALHVSNKYLDFVPAVAALAADAGWMALRGRDADVPAEFARTPSEWMAVSRSLDRTKAIYAQPTSARWRWEPVLPRDRRPPWTDDRTAVAEALRW
jgi:hypothetical protein